MGKNNSELTLKRQSRLNKVDNHEKAIVKFKYQPEDFIVEEREKEGFCKISESNKVFENARIDFGKLDTRDRRIFLACELEKFDIDHMSAIDILCKELRMSAHEIGHAGTKDKRAWTCQRVTLYNPDIELVRNFSHQGIILKNFKWAKHKLQIGSLEGNHFRLTLRDAGKDALKLLEKVRRTQYVPNAFGQQRFGSLRKDNVAIGKLIYKKRFDDAVFALLTGYGEEESDEVKKTKRRLKLEKNIFQAKEYFPSSLIMENKILNYLVRFPKDWIGALKTLDEKTLLLMCQSVQSKIFNDILERVSEARLDSQHLEIILPGTMSKFSEGKLGRIESEVMQDHVLTFEDFYVPELALLTLKGSKRKAFSPVKNLDVRIEEDDLFPLSKKIMLEFELDSGTYATTFLEQFFELR